MQRPRSRFGLVYTQKRKSPKSAKVHATFRGRPRMPARIPCRPEKGERGRPATGPWVLASTSRPQPASGKPGHPLSPRHARNSKQGGRSLRPPPRQGGLVDVYATVHRCIIR